MLTSPLRLSKNFTDSCRSARRGHVSAEAASGVGTGFSLISIKVFMAIAGTGLILYVIAHLGNIQFPRPRCDKPYTKKPRTCLSYVDRAIQTDCRLRR